MKRSKKKWLPTLVLILALAGGGSAWHMLGRGGETVARAVAEQGPMTDTYTVTGTVTNGTEHLVITELAGKVLELSASVDQEVSEGDVLLRVDPSGYEFQLEQAKAQLSAYRAQATQADIGRLMSASPQEYLTGVRDELSIAGAAAEEAGRTYAALQELLTAGAASEDEVAQAKIAYDNAAEAQKMAQERYDQSTKILSELKGRGIGEASLNSEFYASERRQASSMADAQASVVAQLEDAITRCEVKAPVGGTIRELPAEGLHVVGAGQTVAVILPADNEILLEADVLTSIAPYLAPGDAVAVKMDYRGGSENFTGKIAEVNGYAFEDISPLGLKEYKVHIKVRPDEAAAFASLEGYSAQLTLTLFSEENVLSVPSSAVFEADGRHYVYMIEEGAAARREVETGYESPSRTQILSGLSAGDEIIAKVDNEVVYEGAQLKYEN